MAQMADIEKTEAAATQPRVSRLRNTLADISLMTLTALPAFPLVKVGTGNGALIMVIVFYTILVFILGLRGFAAVLLDAKFTSDEPPRWLTLTKSSLAVAIFLSLLFGAAVAISRLSVSDPIRVMLLFGAVAALWALMHRLSRGVLAEKPAVPNEGDSTMMEGRN